VKRVANTDKQGVFLATNVAYYPSIGGTERILQMVAESVAADFERVIVFSQGGGEKPYFINGVEVRRYSKWGLRLFSMCIRPRIYFPNVVHSRSAQENLAFVARFSRRTIVNMVGGYASGFPVQKRIQILKSVQRNADVAVHVDALSTEFLIDKCLAPAIEYRIIPQGLDFDELSQAVTRPPLRAAPYFVHAHNLWHWKRPELFIEGIVAKHPTCRFLMIGSKQAGDRIEQVAALAKHYSNVELLLGHKRPDFLTMLAHAEGVISTSAVEGAQPNIMLECGFMGVPYLTLCPGQNYAHYPHVEVYSSVSQLSARLSELGPFARRAKKEALGRAMRHFRQDRYSWQNVLGQFREMFHLTPRT
jgi:glycosyltransferase involved in cell wall biosynthesis